MITVSFTGHRSFDKSLDGELLRSAIRAIIMSGKRVTFWSGMARGFDLAAAEVVLDFIDQGANATLCCAVPYALQSKSFPLEDKLLYDRILSRASEVVTLEERYRVDVFHRRNNLLVDRAEQILAYYDGMGSGGTAYTVKRAQRAGIRVDNIYPQPQLQLF